MKVRPTVPDATRPAPAAPRQAPPALPAGQAVSRPVLPRAGRTAAIGAAAALLTVAVAACSGGGSSASSVPSVFTPSPHVTTATGSAGASRTPSPSSGQSSGTAKASSSARASSTAHTSSTAHASTPARATATPTQRPTSDASATTRATPRPTVTVTHTQYYPIGAPQTGGGGTAGLQDATLFGVGGAAVLAGFASLAYRRRLTRKRRAEAAQRRSAPTHTPVP